MLNQHVAQEHSTFTLTNVTESQYIRVVALGSSYSMCPEVSADTAQLYIPGTDISLRLELSVVATDLCEPLHKAILHVANTGTHTAEDVACRIKLPGDFLFADQSDTLIMVGDIMGLAVFTDTVDILLQTRYYQDTVYSLQAQVWSCAQLDIDPNTVYGDWDWQGLPRQADEDTGIVRVLPFTDDPGIWLTATNDTVCYDQTASLTATSNIPHPQYYNWWDNTRTVLLHRDTLAGGGVSHFNPTHQTRDSVYYVSVRSDAVCLGHSPARSTVTVRDASAHGTMTCPPDTTVELAYGACDTLLGIGNPKFNYDASLGNINYTITHDAPVDSIYSEGTTVVTWTLTEECGATYNCSQNVVVVYPPCGTPLDSVSDYDGYRYSSVRVGCQCWTGENLRSTHYSDGTSVQNYHYYQMRDSLENLYGKLYSWYSAVRVPEGDDSAVPADSMGFFGPYVQGICPEGWAVPTLEEYGIMFAAAGGTVDKVKEASTLYWLPGKEGTLPNSGFDARGAGYFDQATNRYYNLMGNTYFWTVNPPTGGGTTSSVEYNYYCDLPRISESLKTMGYSIRCIRKK